MSFNQEHVFMSALQPNTSVSTYAVPSDMNLGGIGGGMSDDFARAKRVQDQVALRLMEKSKSLPRPNSHYATSEYAGSSSVKYNTIEPGFSSKSYVYTASKPAMANRASQYSGGYSARSAVDLGGVQRVSMGVGRGGGGGGYQYQDDMRVGGGYHTIGGYQAGGRQAMIQSTMTKVGHVPVQDLETMSMHSMRLPAQSSGWGVDVSDGGSMISERDFSRKQSVYSAVNGTTGGQVNQQNMGTFPRSGGAVSLSGTLTRSGGAMMGGEQMMMVQHQESFKGPAQRTINRVNKKNRISITGQSTVQRQMSSGGSMYGGGSGGGFIVGQVSSGSQGNLQQLNRSMSIRSMHSVGRGRDIYDGQNDMTGSMINVSGLDIPMAVMQLDEDDIAEQVQGAAYIQHECYNNNDAKNEVRICKGIQKLVRLFNSENLEVARYATGATRNLIYENLENKAALIEAGGIPQLIEALKYNDDELRKNITGILWNLSSKDNLKEKLAKETLADLTEKILIPLSGSGDSEVIQQSPSESDIFFNTTGCLRNLSSVNEKTRQKMRETSGLVDALVGYVKASLEDGKVEGKGVENTVCVLRNLSYQLYSEIPPSALLRLEGPSRDQDTSFSQAIGCFTPQSKKLKNKNQDMATFTEVARIPKGVEWLWHPQVVGLYNNVLQGCEINSTTREAAAGALQNITAGDKRWAGVLSRVALDQERMLPVLLDKLRTNNDMELRSLTGFLRNLSRHASDKSAMATKIVQNLVNKLPADGNQKEPSSDVVVNICGALNNLVASSSLAARDITFFDGLQKLVAIKDSHDSSPGKLKAAKAAATVLCNMFQYKKLHKNYKQKGFTRPDFADSTI
ncbi:plakophilin-3 isoform X2 [Esox lucius]|uniref:plakophilin-3 isoform X2 n=1 Tax=Esox lucius TaxID=8010 RepID=UPI0014777422|nr:plakophilin-3 isoform X2 [Esox lucius]